MGIGTDDEGHAEHVNWVALEAVDRGTYFLKTHILIEESIVLLKVG